ncbi:MAG TPA: class I SAM-dependent rRNA methyltransferase [Spirochaetia bacterium]|nr:class I SAM-dependent rRNA methyltransferase [Spirochaetia bacterium]
MSSSSQSGRARVVLKVGRDGPARKRHHPWIYSQAVAEVTEGPAGSDLLPVSAADGTVIGWGFYSPGSLIAVRMVSFSPAKPSEDWIERRMRAAKSLRDALHVDSDAMRLVNAEGDYIPGLIVDLYGDTAVVSLHVRGIEGMVDRIVLCLRDMLPSVRIFLKRDEHYARVEKLSRPSGYLHGTGDGTCTIREGGVNLRVDYERGQKTGYYLDQRANRGAIALCSPGKTVLNLFSYSGAVALRAAAAGAAHVVSVESSKKALEGGRDSVTLNPQLRDDVLEWVPQDVFTFLERPDRYDIVVADPPPFARRRSELEGALKGYLTLFQQCMRILSPGGLAFLFSCSGAVDRPTFQQVVVEAALRSGRSVRLLKELHADVDHPVAAAHPEGEYLKGWMVHAE